MVIVIAGGTGFLGGALAAHLQRDGHELVVLSRSGGGAGTPSSPRGRRRLVHWAPDGGVGEWATAVDGADVVVNLSGESIAGGRWNDERKRRIRDSRVMAARSLTAAIARATSPPALLLSGSAVGYYGDCGDEVVTESHPAGNDFLAGVCLRWEDEAAAAASSGTRVVRIRTGLVLDRRAGALPSILLPFRFGIGGPLGSGRQYMPWIHGHDWVALVSFLITDARAGDATGPVNATAPSPVTNAQFTRTLARVLKRPAFMPVPSLALRLLLGEMADGLLLSGQRAIPDAATQLGFRFAYNELDSALRDLLS